MKFGIIESNQIKGTKLELGPEALKFLRIAIINSYAPLNDEIIILRNELNKLYADGRL